MVLVQPPLMSIVNTLEKILPVQDVLGSRYYRDKYRRYKGNHERNQNK